MSRRSFALLFVLLACTWWLNTRGGTGLPARHFQNPFRVESPCRQFDTCEGPRTMPDREKTIVSYANNEVFNPHPANVGTNELALMTP